MQLHFTTLGPQNSAQAQPLMLLHGLFGSGDNWGTIAKHFSQHYQVISVDLRNHGRSPHSDAHTYADMADDLFEICQTLGLDRIHLLGHSMGGKVAMQFATQYPDKVENLVVVDMAPRAYADAHTHLIDAMLSVDLTRMQTRSEVDKALSSKIPQAMVRQFLLMNLVKSDSSPDAQLTWRINLPALKSDYPQLLQAVCEEARYDKPCLFIRGKQSDYVQNQDIALIQTYFPQAQFVDLPSGHWVHAEQPQAFISEVEKFLSE
jgi:esterase